MKNVLIIALLLLGTVAYGKVAFLDKVILRTKLSSEIVEADDLKARILGFGLGLAVEDQFNPEVKFFFDFSINLETGSNQSVGNIAEFAPTDTIDLNQAGIKYTPISLLEFQVGALNQGEYNSPLLVADTAFAGVKEKIDLGLIYIKLQQAIPSNNRLTKRIGTVEDATPFFGMETIGLTYVGATLFTVEISHFAYKDLSSTTANISRELGNSVSGLNEASEYNYQFEGTNAFMNLEYRSASGFVSRLTGQYLYNDKAPDGRNKGHIAGVGFGSTSLQLSLEHFRNESDSSPSYYNSKYYGHNNMLGDSFAITMTGNDYSFITKYTQAKVIEENLVQSDMNLITFNLVKLYEI